MAQAGVLALGTAAGLQFTGYAILNIGFTLIWLWIVSRLAAEHRRLKF